MEYYTSDSSESDYDDSSTLDYSYMTLDSGTLELNLDVLSTADHKPAPRIQTLLLYHNSITLLSPIITRFTGLKYLDLSSNQLTELPQELSHLPLTTLIAKNNRLSDKGLPPCLGKLTGLKELNLNGNLLSYFPSQLLDLPAIRFLYLGGNKIAEVPKEIKRLQSLEVLSLGGNLLTEVPPTLGQLHSLTALVLSDNQLSSLPAAIASLNGLKSLLLHKNQLRTLPTEIVSLKCLTELSLRDNPLVVRFVSDMTHCVPSLLELSARTVKLHHVMYSEGQVPFTLLQYLDTAHHCINPKCQGLLHNALRLTGLEGCGFGVGGLDVFLKMATGSLAETSSLHRPYSKTTAFKPGVFFDNRVEHVKFVDFCGKYRVPLLQYLCSSSCIEDRDELNIDSDLMRKVLLG